MLRGLDRARIRPYVLLPGKGSIEPELERHGLPYEVWGRLAEPGSASAYLAAMWRAARFYRRNKVRLIHLNTANCWRPAELLAARMMGIPIVVHYHVVIEQPSPFIRWCSAAIPVSRYTAAQSKPAGLPKHVVYNPIDLHRFDSARTLREEWEIPPDATVVSFLGQIRDIKGVQDFIAMARRLRNPSLRFVVAGECRDPRRFPGSYTAEDLAGMIGGDERIRYVGYVREVENVYRTSDVVVVPSRWDEPLGLINLEAGASRRPVVATRVGGIPEVVSDGVNGLLVPPGDVDGLVAAVLHLTDDPREAEAMGLRGRALVENSFTEAPIREFENVLVKLASGGRTSRH
jgi:glycosyltransferase involved in cell wall biosynthesis